MNPAAKELQLRDIHLPDGISWWPPAPGWWLLLMLVVLLIALGAFYYRQRQQRRMRKAAITELNNISRAYETSRDAQQLIQALSIWLRRVCLSVYPRSDVAGLTGHAWLAFLDQPLTAKKHSLRFSEGAGIILIDAPYQTGADVDAEAMLRLCRDWLRCLPRGRGR